MFGVDVNSEPSGHVTRGPPAEKYMLISAIALTLYDYSLMFDDEIRYVWKGRKTWIFYLYILNRILLMGWESWEIRYGITPITSKTECTGGYYVQVLMITFFLFSSDVFIILRIHAVTSKNRIIVWYFGILAVVRLFLSIVVAFANPIVATIHPFPLDPFARCGLVEDFRFQLVPNYIGTVFEVSAFFVIVWYLHPRNRAFGFSAVMRTISTEATVYFFAMVAVHAYSVIGGIDKEQKFSYLACGLFSPILTLRFAISLKKSADVEGGQAWRPRHFATLHSTVGPQPDTERPVVCESIEMDPPDCPQGVGR